MHARTLPSSTNRPSFDRRNFLRAAAGLGATSLSGWRHALRAQAAELGKQGMHCILLWMQGGPSQLETFDPKPGHANGGETKAIDTAVPGIQISENLPQVAAAMQDICLMRSMTSKEGSHPRATYLLHTGYLPAPTVKYPTLGSIVAKELGEPSFDLPNFVRIGRARSNDGGGLLGVSYDPFYLTDSNRPPDNTSLPGSQARYQKRLGLLSQLETGFESAGGRQEVGDHRKLYDKASKLILSPKMEAFDVQKESAAMRESYGDSDFGTGCLMARRLVEAGVACVEVTHGNWDTHDDNFGRSRTLCEAVDRPFARLLGDLKDRGLLERTLVIWMGEFGRTPRVNPRGGRDHFPRAYSVAMAGAGVRGGQVIGATSASGEEVKDRPIGVSDLFRTFCHGLKINADRENMSSIGRPIKIVDGGEVVQEVFG